MSFQTQTLKASQWGLDRIDQSRWDTRKLNREYRYEYTGLGVHAYIIDSGILGTHNEFRSIKSRITSVFGHALITRVVCARNYRLDLNETCDDKWGHGTFVAGIVGGTMYGVAKDVTLYSVKVFGPDGTCRYEDLINSIKYVTELKLTNPTQPMIINLSLGTSHDSKALNAVVTEAVNAGIPVVVAAGNSGVDACTFSPASATDAITVGATDSKEYVRQSSLTFVSLSSFNTLTSLIFRWLFPWGSGKQSNRSK
jgi:subtilisin family serine protease